MSGLQRWTMGSITERVLHSSKLPMLIVRHTQSQQEEHMKQKEAVLG